MSIGIICEYNPFHNGHKYHINKIKEMYPEATIILVMSSNFLQRGEVSLINKWDKCEISLLEGIDLVVELPYVFSSQSADIFAKGALQILSSLKVNKLVFGSETNDIEILKEIAKVQINNNEFNKLVKEYVSEGINYPTAINKAIKLLTKYEINKPNDLLGISYIKEIIKNNYEIQPICLKRTNDYHGLDTDNSIISATSIRNLIKQNNDINKYVPSNTMKYLNCNLHFIDDYFDLLKYTIIANISCLNKYQIVDEGIENRIKKAIYKSNNLEELINNIKSKRYTYNKIKRMLTHILCGFTKEEAKKSKNNEYIRILGFNNKGKKYLKYIKKESVIPIITGYSNIKSEILNIEFRVNAIYNMIEKENRNSLIEMEYKHKPIIK